MRIHKRLHHSFVVNKCNSIAILLFNGRFAESAELTANLIARARNDQGGSGPILLSTYVFHLFSVEPVERWLFRLFLSLYQLSLPF